MSLPSLFSGPPPDRETFVQQHSIPFSPEHWLNRLPEPWMYDLLGEYASHGQTWPRISRQTIIDTAPQINTAREAVQFYVMASAWGVGVNQRFVTRRVWVLTRNENAGERLLAGLRIAQQTSAVAAYTSFRHGGPNRLVHLGPGFFTKILYFGSWDDSPARRPLILDKFVAAALNDVAGLGWAPTWNWTTAQYEQYLDLAAEWASKWGTQPDVVEKTLFDHGHLFK